jgi:hypothetical protein
MRIKYPFLFIFLVLISTSCSQIRYTSTNSIPTYISTKSGHHSREVATGKRKFYLWGLVPREHTVDVDHELSDAGVLSASRIDIREYQTGLDIFLTYISLGLYKSVHYEINTWGYKD